jgi:hypothetical protein
MRPDYCSRAAANWSNTPRKQAALEAMLFLGGSGPAVVAVAQAGGGDVVERVAPGVGTGNDDGSGALLHVHAEAVVMSLEAGDLRLNVAGGEALADRAGNGRAGGQRGML